MPSPKAIRKRVHRCTPPLRWASLAPRGLFGVEWAVSSENRDALERSHWALIARVDSEQQSLKRMQGELSKQRKSLATRSVVAAVLKASQEARQAIDTVGLPRFLPAAIAPIPFAALAFVIGGPWLCAFVGVVLLATSAFALCLPADATLQAIRQTAERELASRHAACRQLKASVDATQNLLMQMQFQSKQFAAEIKAVCESKEHLCQELFKQRWKEMRGEQFEGYLAEVFLALGYEVEQTGKSGDQGVDLIVRRKGRRIAVQAKGYVDSVGNAAVQQAFTGKTFYGCHACAVVTNSRFTASALEAAQATECALVHEENFEDFVFGRVPFG